MTITMDELLDMRGDLVELSTRRGLTDSDLQVFRSLADRNHGHRVRVYSGQGFVPNSYTWPCEIQHVERDYDDDGTERVWVAWGGAQRSRAVGPLHVIQPVSRVFPGAASWTRDYTY